VRVKRRTSLWKSLPHLLH